MTEVETFYFLSRLIQNLFIKFVQKGIAIIETIILYIHIFINRCILPPIGQMYLQ